MRPFHWFACLLFLVCGTAVAHGGPLGIDHRLHYDNTGIWKRSNQKALLYGSIVTVGAGAIAFGDDNKLGDTFWRSVDALHFPPPSRPSSPTTGTSTRPSTRWPCCPPMTRSRA
ncbi:hypothetical protein J7I44_02495 [Frateuria sp. MAH-13]|uniref:Uncharacterized protein n=1 Tax=Frateuria flava TaxID=2821489 RepID=A0ABS4DJB6_9GAMM|nr:hypothetical protein [Frateuria flava]MBP1473149.1 hypothetical protein [Frateuria flava]